MLLSEYVLRTQRLLQNPASPQSLYAEDDIISAINQGRVQLAGEGECLRIMGTIDTVADQRAYDYVDIDTGVSATNGIGGALNVRRIMYGVGTGYKWITPRNWEWFDLYCLNTPVPQSGAPVTWAQYAQGNTGSFYLDPIPDIAYTLQCDCTCYPIDLVDDTTIEAIPKLWEDAVPFIAAFYALLGSQSGQRSDDANKMYERYDEYMRRARQFSNPAPNRTLYSQASDPAKAASLGRSPPQGGGQ